MRVKILAFAGLRASFGAGMIALDLPPGTTLRGLCDVLVRACPAIEPLLPSIRLASNGAIVSLDTMLCDGDEVALLPPVSGG